MSWLRRIYPFNAEQTVNILSEFGPLVTMFIVNAIAGINAGTWALLVSTVVAMVVMRVVLGRLPIFPVIASGVTIIFGAMTLVTGDPMWVQIKVTIFNAMFAGFLFGGLSNNAGGMRATASISTAVLLTLGAGFLGWQLLAANAGVGPIEAIGLAVSGGAKLPPAFTTNAMCIASMLIGFLIGLSLFGRNFFKYSFEKTFHYTDEGWNHFTYSFAWFFVFTAVLNEIVRQVFVDTQMYDVLGYPMNGVNIWILFKIAFIMPLSGIYAWYLTRLMQTHRIPDDEAEPEGRGLAPKAASIEAAGHPGKAAPARGLQPKGSPAE